jgi:tRNA pseudouridine38-40 synthase
LRYFLRLAYFGTPFHGWQIQPNAPSVQQVLNEALSTLFQQPINIVGAGRTDTGVHAKEMYAHFDLEHPAKDTPLLLNRLNKMIGWSIVVYDLIAVPNQAHARFDATSRSYEYHIHRAKNPFLKNLSTCIKYPLNTAAIEEATQLLIGERDYTAFSKTHTQTHTNNCNITQAHWELDGSNWVFYITANRFLRNMVRAIVGTLMQVGKERIAPQELVTIIKSKDRSRAGESAPAEGLYLTKITYPKEILHGRLS